MNIWGRHVKTPCLALIVGLAMGPLPGFDGEGGQDGEDPFRLADVRGVVARSHQFLVTHQQQDGSFSVVRNVPSQSAPIAVTALATLSFLAAGHAPDRGEFGVVVGRAIRWLVGRCNDEGYFYYDDDTVSRMHGQGYALLALTQAYGMAGMKKEEQEAGRQAIVRAIDLIERTQGTVGGWYYDPETSEMHEGSITVCMVQALRSARDAGFAVDGEVIRRAEGYLARSQDEETGRFHYAINDPKTSWALTAAALSTLNALGTYDGESVELGVQALRTSDPFLGVGEREFFEDYGALYAAQAYWHYRDPRVFREWWAAFVTSSEKRQGVDDGRFSNGRYGDVYATAIVSLTLQVPLGYLPIFQR